MSIDLDYDEGQLAIADAIRQFCEDQCDPDTVKAASGGFPTELWQQLADLGMLAIGAPEGDGGAMEMAAAMESLGAAVFPGPLAASFLATQVLGESDRIEVIEGRGIVAVGSGRLVPWAPCATHFLVVDGARIWKAHPAGEVEAVPTLGGEPWGRVDLVREDALDGAARALVFGDIALAAYLAAAGNALVEAASDHAATRTQFGRAIGEFQAVAHPLADCSMRLSASIALARNAAFVHDGAGGGQEGVDLDAGARALASAARLSANAAALEAAYVCHQVFGAIGITLEGPVFHISRRIRQLASQPPGEARLREEMLASFGIAAQSA